MSRRTEQSGCNPSTRLGISLTVLMLLHSSALPVAAQLPPSVKAGASTTVIGDTANLLATLRRDSLIARRTRRALADSARRAVRYGGDVPAQPQRVRMPDLYRLTEAEARDLIRAQAHLEIRTRATRDTSQADLDGRVIAQSPLRDSTVTPTTIVLVVLGHYVPASEPVTVPDSVTVPELRKRPVRRAQDSLLVLGLRGVLDTVVTDAELPRALVLSQRPAAMTRVAVGDVVRLTVFVTPPDNSIEVPDLVDMQQTDAERKVSGLGLVFEVRVEPSAGGSAGRVVAQIPMRGSHVRRGSTVAAVVRSAELIPPQPTFPPPDQRWWWIAALGAVVGIGYLVVRPDPPRVIPPVIVQPTIKVVQPTTYRTPHVARSDGRQLITNDIAVTIVGEAPHILLTLPPGAPFLMSGDRS